MMKNLFFLLSGEHETLPKAEVQAVLKAEKYTFKQILSLPQVLVLKANEVCLTKVLTRCSLTKACGLEIFHCKAEGNEIYERVKEALIEEFLTKGESFAVRVKHIRETLREVSSEELERKIGKLILKRFPQAKVDLKKPSRAFLGILSGNSFIFGLEKGRILVKSFFDRSPLRRPYFHPSTMQPKLARCMVNLARVKKGDVLLDPFCGVGGILIEAGLIGCSIIGLDIIKRRARETIENLQYYGISPLAVGIADARKLPLNAIDAIVTDPPYGRAATTLRRSIKELIESFLEEAYNVLSKGRYACLASPEQVFIQELAVDIGFQIEEVHSIPIHKSLTRKLIVLKR